MSDEDDKATVVIDLNKLKKEKELKDKELASLADALEFSHAEPKKPVAKASLPVILFGLGSDVFTKHKEIWPPSHSFHHAATLPELNAWLKKKVPFVLCLPLDVNPKAINQLCVQLHAKYPQVKVVIVGQSLTPAKIEIHKKSPAAAAAYLGYPFKSSELSSILDRFTRSKAA